MYVCIIMKCTLVNHIIKYVLIIYNNKDIKIHNNLNLKY